MSPPRAQPRSLASAGIQSGFHPSLMLAARVGAPGSGGRTLHIGRQGAAALSAGGASSAVSPTPSAGLRPRTIRREPGSGDASAAAAGGEGPVRTVRTARRSRQADHVYEQISDVLDGPEAPRARRSASTTYGVQSDGAAPEAAPFANRTRTRTRSETNLEVVDMELTLRGPRGRSRRGTEAEPGPGPSEPGAAPTGDYWNLSMLLPNRVDPGARPAQRTPRRGSAYDSVGMPLDAASSGGGGNYESAAAPLGGAAWVRGRAASANRGASIRIGAHRGISPASPDAGVYDVVSPRLHPTAPVYDRVATIRQADGQPVEGGS